MANDYSTNNQATATAGSGWVFTLAPEVLFGKWQPGGCHLVDQRRLHAVEARAI